MSIPEKLGKYQILSKIGEGAMGVVYLGRDTRLGRLVALKTMSPQVAAAPDLVERFYREAQSAGQLQHPNIVTIFEIDEDNGIPFIAMPFLEGDTLEKIISTRQPLAMIKKFDIVIQICRGLNYAHENGIVHRDIKPANVMVLKDGLVKILDFGIARIVDLSITHTGWVGGTPAYMSPEQISGEPVDGRSDTYSAGVILYELLTYTKPFNHKNFLALRERIVNQEAEPLGKILADCPSMVERVMTKVLAKRREDRYEHADDFALDLQQVSDFFGRHQLQIYIEEGRRSLDRGELTVARESLQKALQIDSSHDLARSLLDNVQEQIAARRRAQKIEQDIRQAKEALRTERFDEAISLLDEVLELSPGHETAQQYRLRAIELRDRLQKIGQHMERAEKLVSDASLQEAKIELEAVLALDREHAAALKLLDWVLQELAARERQRQVQQLIADSRVCVAQNDLDRAMDLLQEALRLDPVDIEIETLLRQVRSSQEREKSRQRLTACLAGVQKSLDGEDLDQAVILARQALEEFPDNPQVLRLQAQARRLAESDKTRRFVEGQLQAARGYLQQNKHDEASAVLQGALKAAPGDMRLLAFLKSVREAQEIFTREAFSKQALREGNHLIREGNFPSAIQAIERAIAQVGELPELWEALKLARELESEQQAKERVKQVLGRAGRFLLDDSYEDAIRVLELALREADSTEITALLAIAREQCQRFEIRLAQTIERARQLLTAGEANRSVALLEAAPTAYLKNDQFRKLYAQCKESLDRAAFVEATLSQVDKCIAAQDLHEAATLLQQALEKYPAEPALVAAEKRLRTEQLEISRVRWSKQIAAARATIGHTENQRAIEILTGILPEIAELPELVSEAQALLEEAQSNERQAALREQAILKASAEIQNGNLSSAIQILQGAIELAGESNELIERLRLARERLAEKVSLVLGAARKHLQEENSAEAICLLERAQLELGSNEIKDLLSHAREQQRTSEDRRAAILKKATQLLGTGEAAQGVALLDAAPKAYFDLSEFQRVYALCREGLDRATFVRSTLGRVEAYFASADLSQAEAMLQQALQKYPSDPALLDAQRHLREQQLRLRRIEWQKCLDESEAAANRMEYGRVIEILSGLPAEFADVPELAPRAKALQERAHRGQQQLAARDKALREARGHIEKKNFTSAIAILEKAIATVGELPGLADLLKFALERQRAEQVSQVLARARALLSEDNFEESIRVLEKAQRELGGTQIESQLATVREEWQTFEQRRADMVEEATRMLVAAEPGRAAAFLDTAPRAYFRNEHFQRLYARCREDAARDSAVRTTLNQLKQYLLSESLDQAQALLDSALRVYPDEPNLSAAQQQLREEQLRLRRRVWAKVIDEAKIAIGRLEYRQAIQILESLPEELAEAPELTTQAAALLEEARVGEQTRREKVITPPALPLPRPKPPKPKPWRATIGGAAALLVLVAIAFGAWQILVPSPPKPPPRPQEQGMAPGYVQLNAIPYADISVQTASGKVLDDVKGQTPVQVELPPGQYLITLRYGQATDVAPVTVVSGSLSSVDYKFPGVNVNEIVDDLLSSR